MRGVDGQDLLAGSGGHGHGGHGHGHGRGGFGGFYEPWWPMYYDDDVDELYGDDHTEQLAEAVARKLAEKKTAVGKDMRLSSHLDGESGFDFLGAETFTGADWLNVLKNAAGSIANPDSQKKPAEKPAPKTSGWTWAIGGAVVGGLFAVLFGRR